MKTKLLIIIFFTFSANAFSQYKAMLGLGAKWHTNHIFFGADNETYTISKDTIINDTTYYQITESWTNPFSAPILLREDTANRKVYLKYSNNEEKIIYDFSMSVGDTINSYNFSIGYSEMILDSISSNLTTFDSNFTLPSIFIENPKIFHFSNGVKWIEGIGSLGGPLGSTIGWDGLDMLMCHYDSANNWNYHFYYSQDDPLCEGPEFAILEYNNDNNITIYPNPANDFLQIGFKTSNNESIRIELFDCIGNRIMIDETNSSQQHELEIQTLKNGIYFLQIYSDDTLIETKKIIKQ